MEMASFGERLSELRKEKGKSHEDMAKILGITRQAYGHYESDKREPDFNTLTALADYFGVITDYILGKSEYRTAEELAAAWKEVADQAQKGAGVPEQSASGGRAYYGGGKDWTEEEKAAADAFIETLRKRRQKDK